MPLLVFYCVCIAAAAAIAIWRPPSVPRYNLLLIVVALPHVGSTLGVRIPSLFLVAAVAAAIWCRSNWSVAGVPLVAVGLILNLLVMAVHGGAMPIRTDVLAAAGYTAPPGAFIGAKDVVVETSPLWLLSDWVVVPSGRPSVVVSPGDLMVIAGIGWWLTGASTKARDHKGMCESA